MQIGQVPKYPSFPQEDKRYTQSFSVSLIIRQCKSKPLWDSTSQLLVYLLSKWQENSKFWPRTWRKRNLCVWHNVKLLYIYIYIYIYTHTYTHIFIYVYNCILLSLKKVRILSYLTIWITTKGIMLSKIKQAERERHLWVKSKNIKESHL